jgi:N-hydroxyarylamine O-acetyltransferase
MDLDAYFQRIGHSGGTIANLETLEALVLAHTWTIPFENLDVLLERAVPIDIADLERKLVGEARGGYCFEHNTLLGHALGALGFQVTGLAARVVMNQPPGVVLPRTHMLLRVDLDDGPVIVDAGFGGLTLTGVLRLQPDTVQDTPHEPFRLASREDGFQLQARVGDTWMALYEFDLQAQCAPDFEMMNYFTATYPGSVFRHMLMAARVTAEGRIGLRNNILSIHTTGEASERRVLESGAEIRAALAGPFGIALPDDPGLKAVFERFATESG